MLAVIEDEFNNDIIILVDGNIYGQTKMKCIPPVGSYINFRIRSLAVEKFLVETITISEYGSVIWLDGKLIEKT